MTQQWSLPANAQAWLLQLSWESDDVPNLLDLCLIT
jgi:hypothetical protein